MRDTAEFSGNTKSNTQTNHCSARCLFADEISVSSEELHADRNVQECGQIKKPAQKSASLQLFA
jgi:hypothetical protein